MNDFYYLEKCEEIGVKAAAKGNPPVGALIVKDDVVLAEAEEAGRSKNDITCHAELEAIRKAVKALNSNDLSACTLYSSHEPCIMCSYAIRFHKIKKVVYRQKVDFLGGSTSSMPLLISDDVPPHWSKAPEVIHFQG